MFSPSGGHSGGGRRVKRRRRKMRKLVHQAHANASHLYLLILSKWRPKPWRMRRRSLLRVRRVRRLNARYRRMDGPPSSSPSSIYWARERARVSYLVTQRHARVKPGKQITSKGSTFGQLDGWSFARLAQFWGLAGQASI